MEETTTTVPEMQEQQPANLDASIGGVSLLIPNEAQTLKDQTGNVVPMIEDAQTESVTQQSVSGTTDDVNVSDSAMPGTQQDLLKQIETLHNYFKSLRLQMSVVINTLNAVFPIGVSYMADIIKSKNELTSSRMLIGRMLGLLKDSYPYSPTQIAPADSTDEFTSYDQSMSKAEILSAIRHTLEEISEGIIKQGIHLPSDNYMQGTKFTIFITTAYADAIKAKMWLGMAYAEALKEK